MDLIENFLFAMKSLLKEHKDLQKRVEALEKIHSTESCQNSVEDKR